MTKTVDPDWHASSPVPKEAYIPAIGAPPEDVWVMGNHPTHNPDGVTNSNVDYYPKTQEEKAERIEVEMVELTNVDPNEPYPEGDPPNMEDAVRLTHELHTEQELVGAENWHTQHEANLAAGGMALPEDVVLPPELALPPEADDADTRSPTKDRAGSRKGKARRSR